jgi:hypothetical protein
MIRNHFLRSMMLSIGLIASAMSSAHAGEPKIIDIAFEDQFANKQELKKQRGKVVVLVYGDRKAMDACKQLGETFHVTFHPTAKDQPPEKAMKAPVAALPNLAAGVASPDVLVVPVACTGKIPNIVKDVIQGQIKKASPHVPIWMDSQDTMKDTFGMTSSEPNLVVIDALGRARHLVNGKTKPEELQKIAQVIQDLRVEALK